MVKVWTLALCLAPILLHGQPAKKWDESLLTGVVWSFQMTYEPESGDIVEKADTSLVCDLLLDSSHSYELFDRDRLIRGIWDLQGDILMVSFREVGAFTLAQLTINQLDLQFQAGRKQYIHRFVRQPYSLQPPQKPRSSPPPRQAAPDPEPPSKEPLDKRTWLSGEREIRVELTGGGYFGGSDPVLRDFILIKENGRLIRERQTVNTGLHTEKATLSMRQLAELADFIRSNGFFEMETRYGCTDATCEGRLQQEPKPIPLRLAVTDGLDRHVVEVVIWDENAAQVSFPPNLKRIVEEIRRLSE